MCTGIRLTTAHKDVVYARTLEFGIDLQSQLLYIPVGHEHIGLTPDGKTNGLKWRSLYSVVGLNAFGSANYIDGVNQEGLAGGLFYFPGYAQYQNPTETQLSRSLPMWQVLTWLLTTCASIKQVREGLPAIYVTDTPFARMGSVPAHLVLHDAHGASLVVEYLNGQLHMFDNPLGVITNDPSFDWHMTNVNNYLALSTHNPPPRTLNGVHLHSFGLGSGLLGLPGDFTPPSRFIRAVAYSTVAPKLSSSQDAILHAFHILNNFDIPYGIVRDEEGNSDHTLWTSASDLTNRIFYFKTYDNQEIQKVELGAIKSEKILMVDLKSPTYSVRCLNL